MSVKFTARTTLDQLKSVQQQVQQLPTEAYNYFRSITPVDTGNARRNTSLNGTVIEGNYPYAKRLDEGWSKQARRGMIKPTQEFIKRRVRQITGR
jgi:hypothetical protein